MPPARFTTLPLPDLTKELLGPNDRDSVNIDAIIRFIRRSRRLCLIWIFVSLCAGIAFIMLARPYYTAYAAILLEERAWRPLADTAGGAVAADPAYADGQVQVLQADEVVGRVIDQNRLVSDPEFGAADGVYALIMSYIGSSSPIKQPPRNATMLRVKRALFIRRVGLTNVVEIAFTSQDPIRAAMMANAIARSYIDGQREQKQALRADAASYVRERLAELREKAFAIDQRPQISAFTMLETGEQARTQLRELQNNAETYRALYNNFLQRAYTEYDPPLSGARVITPAEPPAERSWPRAILILAFAVVGGAAAGGGHALLRQATDHSLRTVEDVQRSTGLDRVAVVSVIRRRAWKTGRPWFFWAASELFPRLSIRAADLLQSFAAYRKTYRQLGWRAASIRYRRSRDRSQLRDEPPERGLQPAYVKCSPRLHDVMNKVAVRLHGGRTLRGKLIIGVASPTRRAGASSIAAHLATVIAKSGQKTLLVDANWRKPSGAPTAPSLQPDRTLASTLITVPAEPESLDVLVLRAMAPISELNAALSIVTTLKQLAHDCVVVDFHSAEQTADLEACMAVLKKVIVVAEAGKTSSESLRGFVRLVPRDKIAAIVLNKIKIEPSIS